MFRLAWDWRARYKSNTPHLPMEPKPSCPSGPFGDRDGRTRGAALHARATGSRRPATRSWPGRAREARRGRAEAPTSPRASGPHGAPDGLFPGGSTVKYISPHGNAPPAMNEYESAKGAPGAMSPGKGRKVTVELTEPRPKVRVLLVGFAGHVLGIAVTFARRVR